MYYVVGLFGYTCDFGVDYDASAVFTHDDFFAKFDFELLLGRDAVEASSAGVTLDVNHAEAVAGVFTDAFEGVEGVCVDFGFEVFGLLAEALFILACFRNDFFKLGFLFAKHVLVVGNFFFCGFYLGGLVFNLS